VTTKNRKNVVPSDRWLSCRVRPQASLTDALRAIDRGGAGIALVESPGGRLVGLLTDGDVRRALLGGAGLESRLAPHMRKRFISVRPQAGRAEVLDLMQSRFLSQVPVVDESGRCHGLHVLRELIGGSERPHWAVIMAGGLGMRLRPITERLPKPMIRIAGRPILERLLLHLQGFGIRRFFFAVNYLGHLIEDHFGDGSQFGCSIDYLREKKPLGTGGALSLLPERPAHPLVVLNGDLLTQVNLDLMLQQHASERAALTVGVKRYAHQIPYGCVEVSGRRLLGLEEKPVLERLVNAGIYVVEPRLVARVPRAFFPMTELIAGALKRRERVGAFEIEEDWLDVGQREQLRQGQEGVA